MHSTLAGSPSAKDESGAFARDKIAVHSKDGQRALNASLFKAIEDFDVPAAARQVLAGADPNAVEAAWGRSPLYRAVSLRDSAMAMLLLDCGADPLRVEEGGQTALHMACREAMLDVVQRLLESGADPNARNKEGVTPLILAAHNDAAEVLQVLLVHGASAQLADKTGYQPIHIAAQQRSLATLAALLDEGVPVDVAGSGGRTPLHLAARAGWPEGVELLIEVGANISAIDEMGRTAWHYLIEEFDEQCARLLLSAGCPIDEKSHDGLTPAALASKSKHPQAALRLIAMGADSHQVQARSMHGLSALHAAARVGWGDQLLHLLSHGANPEEVRGRRTVQQVMEEAGHQEALCALHAWLAQQQIARIRRMGQVSRASSHAQGEALQAG